MPFWALILKNLLRRPARSALTLLALTTAVAAIICLLGISSGFKRSFADVYAAHGIDIVVSRQGSADRLSSSVDETFAEEIAKIPRVAKSAAVLLETMSFEEEAIYGVPSMGIAYDSWLLEDYSIERGSIDSGDIEKEATLTSPKLAGGEKDRILMLGIHLADRINIQVGESVNLFDESYRVTGIFTSPSAWENGSILFPLADLQRLTDRKGQATYINVALQAFTDKQQAGEVVERIRSLDAKLLPLPTADFVQTDTRMQLAGAMAWMTSTVALLLGSIGTLNTMLTSVLERTHEIGILRAMGWPKRRVVNMILLESTVLASMAAVVGCISAIALTWLLAQAPAAKGIVDPTIDSKTLSQGFLMAISIGLIGAVWPAWRASRLLPSEAFRE